MQVEPLGCNPALCSNRNLTFHSYEQIGSHPRTAVIRLSANNFHDDQRSVDTPNDLSDCHDSSDEDDGYCPAAKSNFRHIHIPNIHHSNCSDSDDDNVDDNSKRLSTIDGTMRDDGDMSNIDDDGPCSYSKVGTSHACAGDTASRCVDDDEVSDGYSKVGISTCPGDTVSRHSDSSDTGDNDACGYSKVATSNSAQDETSNTHISDTDSSSSDDACGYSNAMTSSTHANNIPSSDVDSVDGGDNDISCYSTMITRSCDN